MKETCKNRTSSNRESLFRKKKNCESFHDTHASFLSKITFESDFQKKTFWCVTIFRLFCSCIGFSCVGFSFFSTHQEIGWEGRLHNDLFCVEWDVVNRVLLAGSLVVAGGLVILCVVDCRHGNVLLVCVSLTTGCVAMQYLGVMSLPLELSRGNAAVVGALSSLIANVVKFTASFGLCHVAQAVCQCSSS